MNIRPPGQQGAHDHNIQVQEAAPLADRLRPKTAEEVIGQDHVLDTLALTENIIFWGPPG